MGITRRGSIMLRYLTIAPRLLTLKPIASNTVKEKNRQKCRRFREAIPSLWKKMKRRNSSSNALISMAAARERICFTSLGYGRTADKVIACGILLKKLIAFGASSLMGIVEPPLRLMNSCCLLTTACGKSKRGLIYRAVKNKTINRR